MFDQCILPVMTYDAESLTKTAVSKLQVTQRAMEIIMLGQGTLHDRIPNATIWAGHVARTNDDR